MEQLQSMGVEPLSAGELEGTTGATKIGYAVGWLLGYTIGLIADADPFDGNYYGVGA